MVGTVKKSTDTIVSRSFSRKVRQVCDGGLRPRAIYLPTLVSPMSMPSLRSSPWMRGAPQRVVAAHLANQFSSFLADRRSSRLSATHLPRPKQPKPLAVPANHRLRFHDHQGGPPAAPQPGQPRPQISVPSSQLGSLH